VTTLAVGNVGKQHDSVTVGHDFGGCCGAAGKPRSDDTSRIVWFKLMARVGDEFPLARPK